MNRLRGVLPLWLIVVAAMALSPAGASAAPLMSVTASGSSAWLRTCHASLLEPSRSVRTWHVTAAESGLLVAKMRGRASDWDVAVLGAGGRYVAAAAGPTSNEIASGFVAAGEPLTVQACLGRGGASTASVTVQTFPQKSAGPRKVQILSVKTPTQADRNRLMALGMDDTHSHTDDTLDIVVSDPEDYVKLAEAGFEWTVEVADLVAVDRRRAQLDREYASKTKRSAFPSGRTEYRHLPDYESEMKTLATKNPGLVKLITLPNKSLEGRDILGLEIAQNVNVPDGKPVFVQLGVHHAREWPAGEHPMEWAYELINGYGKNDRVTKIVNATRTIVVPIVNPDGFNLSREEPVDTGGATGEVNLPPDVDNQLPISDPAYTASILADQNAGTFAYKRRNCRVKDGARPGEGECANRDNRTLGVDPNRNYGGFWGGPGASLDPGNDTYRGAGPFSEPETQNIQTLISTHQVATMITNHTFSNLVLRPPGIKNEGTTPDEAVYKALGDAMAAQNGYTSEHGYQLYDTTGTTEDWSYFATGGFGFTFEIGPGEFHPPFERAVAEYDGAGQYAGKGNRAAYFIAAEHTADASHHSVLTGSAPAGTVLRLHKEFMSSTSPVIKEASGITDRPVLFKDVLDTKMTVGDAGKFEWHVNPSTRPYAQKDRKFAGVADKPAFEQDISSATPVPPGAPLHIEFEVKPDAARQIRASITSDGPDYDIYLYYGSVGENNQVASSAGSDANETISYGFPPPGKYILEIENYSAVAPYNGKIEVYGEKPGTVEVTPASKESWTLTCETATGTVIGTRKVDVDRGQRKDLGDACREAAGTDAALKLGVSVTKKKTLRLSKLLRSKLRAAVKCSRECTATATLRSGKKVVAKSKKTTIKGTRTLSLRFTKKGRKALTGKRAVTLKLVVLARDRLGNVKSKTIRLRVKR